MLTTMTWRPTLAILAVVAVAGVAMPPATAAEKRSGCDLPMSVRATKDLRSVAGLKRTEVLTECERADPEPGRGRGRDQPEVERSRYDIYGDCSTENGGSCWPPLQIATAPACQGSVDDLLETIESGLGPDGELIRRRGVRVISMSEGRDLHIATGRLTISIFAETAGQARKALRALRGPRKDPTGDLPREIRSNPVTDPLCHLS